MSVSVLGEAELDALVSPSSVTALATSHNLTIPHDELPDWSILLSGLNACPKQILSLSDYHPIVDPSLHPRTSIYRPSGPIDTDEGGWAWKCNVRCTKPTSDLLKGKTLAIKDNVDMVAGIPCLNGNDAVDWILKVNATVVTRILDAGGVILGKAACENNCFGAVSDTSITGPVHNPQHTATQQAGHYQAQAVSSPPIQSILQSAPIKAVPSVYPPQTAAS